VAVAANFKDQGMKYPAILIALFSPFLLFSQRADSVRVKKVLDRWDDKIVLEFTNDLWLDAPSGVEHRIPSIGFKAYFFSDYPFGQESIVSFAWGFGISADNVHSNAAFTQEVFEDGTTGDQVLTPFPENYEYEKNKFGTTYLEVPLELRLITKGRSPFKFAVGFRVGYLLGDKQKIIDTEGKRKIFDFEHVNSWRYGLSARMGIGKVALTGFYSLVPLIEDGKGTELIPVSVGIAIVPFR
jgi:hypothetical protein